MAYQSELKQYKVRGKNQGDSRRPSIKIRVLKLDKEGNPIPDLLSMKRGLAPNFVHSLDGLIAASIVDSFKREGLDVLTVHDSVILSSSESKRLLDGYTTLAYEVCDQGRFRLNERLGKAVAIFRKEGKLRGRSGTDIGKVINRHKN